MARVASRRAVKPAVKPVASNSITNYARLSKGQALAIDKLDKKVLAACLPNFKPSPLVTVTSIHNSSDEENRKTLAFKPSSGLGEIKSTHSKKRKATAEDETSITLALTTTSKRQRIKSDGPRGDLPSAPACQTNRLTQTTITIASPTRRPEEGRPQTRPLRPSSSPITDAASCALEIDTERGTGRIDEDSLCKQFQENLHALCAERATDEMSDLDVSFESLSFNDLPKADITMRHHLSAMKQNPLLAKGQRALTELKHGFVVKQQEKEAKAQAAKEPITNADGSKMSLLDRLRAKELAAAQLDAPSGPEITRKRALQHVSDVSAIIGMLVNSSNPGKAPVKSFPMSVLQQKLKESLRVPMPIEEGVCTVKLIANEVAPEWLRVLPIGSKEHVVVQTRCKPCEAEISARVGRLC
ncbi:conserved hypothetical protein [Verticillium alfalfae VaMs.102]|uniref:DNA replication factor Cdt1 C-terminal domain-containing protein n=1 Tax=Verticillium alfalfae (strain VaMs.102 / ATCC MYA-4576 / FGSC 10136) TaxID=526221 RepID=C9S5P0_VERA1|nr:conserved hypothetical protein [Verticillium alfalfae VaMs.102]EEY14266.1 conserved hypothetical protein [Verticillium alfalfae VaMs.102]